MEKDDIGN